MKINYQKLAFLMAFSLIYGVIVYAVIESAPQPKEKGYKTIIETPKYLKYDQY